MTDLAFAGAALSLLLVFVHLSVLSRINSKIGETNRLLAQIAKR